MSDNVQLNILVPDDLRKRAKAAAALRGTTLSEIVRNALEEFLEDAEDVAVAKETMARIKRGEERPYPAEDVWAELDALQD